MKRPKPIPPFKTLEEEAHFWDTHSVTELWDKKKMVKVVFNPDEEKNTVVHIKVSSKAKQLIDKKAKQQASTISQLLRSWVYQKLSESPQ